MEEISNDEHTIALSDKEKNWLSSIRNHTIYFGRPENTHQTWSGEDASYPSTNLLETIHGLASAEWGGRKSPLLRSCNVSALLCLGMLVEEYTHHISTPFEKKHEAYKTNVSHKRQRKVESSPEPSSPEPEPLDATQSNIPPSDTPIDPPMPTESDQEMDQSQSQDWPSP